MIRNVDHIGIAVKELEPQVIFYRDILGLKFLGYEDLPDRHLKVAVFDAGNVHLELLYPTSNESTVAKFIERNGEGIHHIAFKSKNAQSTLDRLKENGIRLIDETPKPGAGGSQVAFMHPKSTFRVLMEICEHD